MFASSSYPPCVPGILHPLSSSFTYTQSTQYALHPRHRPPSLPQLHRTPLSIILFFSFFSRHHTPFGIALHRISHESHCSLDHNAHILNSDPCYPASVHERRSNDATQPSCQAPWLANPPFVHDVRYCHASCLLRAVARPLAVRSDPQFPEVAPLISSIAPTLSTSAMPTIRTWVALPCRPSPLNLPELPGPREHWASPQITEESPPASLPTILLLLTLCGFELSHMITEDK